MARATNAHWGVRVCTGTVALNSVQMTRRPPNTGVCRATVFLGSGPALARGTAEAAAAVGILCGRATGLSLHTRPRAWSCFSSYLKAHVHKRHGLQVAPPAQGKQPFRLPAAVGSTIRNSQRCLPLLIFPTQRRAGLCALVGAGAVVLRF